MTIRSLSDIETMEATPLAARNLPTSTYVAIASAATRTPDAKALTYIPEAKRFERSFTWTYSELLAEITRAANAFHAFGVTSQNPVAYVMPNLPETHFTIWGGEAAGVAMAINPLLEPAQIAHLLRTVRARVLVTVAPNSADAWDSMLGSLANLPDLKVVALAEPGQYREGAARDLPTAPGRDFRIVRLSDAMAEQPADRLLIDRALKPDDVSSQFCTGGTTGLPKIAIRTHRAEVFDAWAVGRMLGAKAGQRTFFCGLPLFHVNAQLVTGLLPWMNGDHVVIGTPDGYRSKDLMAGFWDIVAHYRVSLFSGVPTIYATLLEMPTEGKDLSSLEFAICGAAPMPATLIEAFETRTGVKILEGYGLTEGTCVSSVNPPAGQRIPGSIGLRLPYQAMQAIIVDDHGRYARTADVDEVGLIVIRGPNVFRGYLEEGQNAAAWIEINGERWLNTGDLGAQDQRGYFRLAGRRKELIIRAGHNIDPKVIEDALCRHPAVDLAAAIGRPDGYAGEIPVAYVQLKPGSHASGEELLSFASGLIPERAALPKRVCVLAKLPVTVIGKISKPALQLMEIESVVREEARKLRAEIEEIAIEPQSNGGPVVTIRMTGDQSAFVRALSRYTFRSEIH